jgi:predicted CopG family antitoxin
MSTAIRVSDEARSKLSVLKDDEESWNDFLNRLARQEPNADELGGFADDTVVEGTATAREEVRDNWYEQVGR